MRCCGTSCFERDKHVVYLIGRKQYKDAFIKNIFGLTGEKEAYSEFTVNYKSMDLIVQMCDMDTQPYELDELHSSLACIVVYLTEEDRPVTFGNYTLLVLMNARSKQFSEDRLTVTSVVDGSFDECKKGFDMLVGSIKGH
ncbi:hypothetical protein PAPHI01_0107 [Pancytospora philotis]|nr:hypothetical protein PAPHI01_0107 [Pancytospora philotis]